MLHRHWIGDVILAGLIAIPTAVLAQPDPVPQHQAASTPVQKSLASAADRQIGLYR
jgi:membrane-associated phospholipid phosphatase